MRILFVVLFMSMIMAAPIGAQEVSMSDQLHQIVAEARPEKVGESAFRLFNQLDKAIADAQRYSQSLEVASAEDSLVLQLQFQKAQERFIVTMGELRGLAVNRDESPELSQSLTRIHEVLTPYLWGRIEAERAEISDKRANRTGAAPGDLAILEYRIAEASDRLLIMLNFTGEHLLAMKQLGSDPERERKQFHALLVDLADELSGRMELAQLRATKLNLLIKEKPDDTDLPLRSAANKDDLTNTANTLGEVLDLMKEAGIPNKELRSQVVSVTQDLTTGVLDVKVGATLARKAWKGITTWLRENAPGYMVKVLVVLVIMTVGWLLSRLVRKAVEKSLERAKVNISQLLKRTITNFAHKLILVLALMISLAQFGISLGPLLAGFGVVGFILGFAMQDSLSNFASGMMILFYRPYDVGDLVEISGAFGKVEHMSMVSTSVLTLDNQKLVVPNSKIWGDVIKNVTDQRVRRVDMTFGISYSDDIPHTEEVLNAILAENDLVLSHPEPMVRLHTLNDSSVDFIVRPWVRTDDYWEVYWAVTREVKMRFDAEEISIPFPQRDVHLYPAAKEGEAEA
jgi:small conductance mechanosensitive channel